LLPLQVLSDESLIESLQEAILEAQPIIKHLTPTSTASSSSSSSSSSGDALTVTQDTVPVMLSGAGHDAMAIADITKIGMVFVRCAGGVSHNPAEFVHPRDVAAAAAAFATFMEMDLLDRGLAASKHAAKDEL
jgi:acetylornithine deacetylase/succinyl-diaminopimelate desuccinylase-like protein